MTTQTLTGVYLTGYLLTPSYDTWVLAKTGTVRGDGFVGGASQAYTLTNLGWISANTPGANGITFLDGGRVVNGAGDTIGGYNGVDISGASGTVTNHGTIASYGDEYGVVLRAGGAVVNGSNAAPSASISGYRAVKIEGGAGVVINFGTLTGSGNAVVLVDGGAVTNGTDGDHGADISGYGRAVVVFGGAGTIANFGTIAPNSDYAGSDAVSLVAGGRVTNGSATDTTASIHGDYGVVASSAAAMVVNFGSIQGNFDGAVGLYDGGSVANGTATSTFALISARYVGVRIEGAAGTVSNFGTIVATDTGALGEGIYLGGGGSVINHGQVSGYKGIVASSTAAVYVSNFGTVHAATGPAITCSGPAGVSNAVGGLISGATSGVVLSGAIGTLFNSGSISGQALDGLILYGANIVKNFVGASVYGVESGVLIESGAATLTNQGTIEGSTGVTAADGIGAASQTVINSGTIIGTGGTAVLLARANDLLVVDPGAVFTGIVDAGKGTNTLELAAGTGTLDAIGINFVNFQNVQVDAVGSWTLTGINTIGSTGTLVNSGTIGTASTLGVLGSLSATGTISGTGTLLLNGGIDTLTGATLAIAHTTISNAAVTLSGTITNSGAISATTTSLVIAAAGVSLTGSGSLALTPHATNAITGATTTATLTNVNNKISGSGQLGNGKMVLVNQALGTINANSATVGLVINTGAATITNAGLIETVAAGGMTISSAINNTGSLLTQGATLTVTGAVSGAGTVKIGAGGTADFTGAFNENVFFTGTTGTLELAHSQAYTGSITGFSKTVGTNLDLLDIAFAAGTTKASFSGTTASGVVTVTDGTHTAKITLIGNYTASVFVVASDGHGGTLMHDPSKLAVQQPKQPVLAFAQAAAGLGSALGESHAVMLFAAHAPPMLAASRVALA